MCNSKVVGGIDVMAWPRKRGTTSLTLDGIIIRGTLGSVDN